MFRENFNWSKDNSLIFPQNAGPMIFDLKRNLGKRPIIGMTQLLIV
jgi:hypothetical protein